MKTQIELSETEVLSVRQLLDWQIEKFNQEQQHALANGGELISPTIDSLVRVVEKIDAA